jgi:tRNA(Ile2) C34 agmatinyltransferase TiaS
MGKDQGFRCEKCGTRDRDIGKVAVDVKRELEVGLYVTSTRSQRHLTKPLVRYGQEKQSATEGMIEEWHSS